VVARPRGCAQSFQRLKLQGRPLFVWVDAAGVSTLPSCVSYGLRIVQQLRGPVVAEILVRLPPFLRGPVGRGYEIVILASRVHSRSPSSHGKLTRCTLPRMRCAIVQSTSGARDRYGGLNGRSFSSRTAQRTADKPSWPTSRRLR